MKISLNKIFFLLAIGILYVSLAAGQPAQILQYRVPEALFIGKSVDFSPFNTRSLNLQEGYVYTTAGNPNPIHYNEVGRAHDMAFGIFKAMVYSPDGSLYFCDDMYSSIRKISPSGEVTIFVDGANLPGPPSDLEMDSHGNIYFSESSNQVIRRVTPSGAVTVVAGAVGVSGYADGQGSTARFTNPTRLAIDGFNNLYVIDSGNKRIRKITPEGMVSTLAGNGNTGVVNGKGTLASFRNCYDIDTDLRGNVYVSEYTDHLIRKITPWGHVTTYVGGGTSGLYYPTRITINKANGDIYVAGGTSTVHKITPSPTVTSVIGNGNWGQSEGLNSEVWYEQIDAVLWSPDGGLLIADSDGGSVGYLRTCRNDPYSIFPALPSGMTFDAGSGEIVGTPSAPSPLTNYEVKAYHYMGQPSTTFSFSVQFPKPWISYDIPSILEKDEQLGFPATNEGGDIRSLAYIKGIAGNMYSANPGGEGNAFDVSFGNITATLYAPDGNIYIADDLYNGIRKLSPDGKVIRFAGGLTTGGVVDGMQEAASFNHIGGMTMDSHSNLYVSEKQNHIIRKITPDGNVTTFAGVLNSSGYVDGVGSSAQFSSPGRIVMDDADVLYVVDFGNRRIRTITPTGVVSTLAGTGSNAVVDGPGISASFASPTGIDLDSEGNIYVSESSAGVIRKITTTGYVSTYTGIAGQSINVDGIGIDARFFYPQDLAIDRTKDNIYVAQADGMIRTITPLLEVTTISGGGEMFAEDGPASELRYENLKGLSWGQVGGLLISDGYSDQAGWLCRYEKGSYSINPELPAGLSIGANGLISGKPSSVSPSTNYEVIAYNNFGQYIVPLSFSVESISASSLTPSQDKNYIIETIVRKDSITTTAQLGSLTISDANRSISYFDNLGRPIQYIQWQVSPNKKDIVQHMEYDISGRESKKYLPYKHGGIANGTYRTGGSVNVVAFYDANWIKDIVRTAHPLSQTIFEKSSLNRVLEQGAPGRAWQPEAIRGTTGRTVVSDYGTNNNSEVALWTISVAGAESTSQYLAGKLFKSIVKDENWTGGKGGTVEEYKDFDNRVVLKRVWKNEEEALNTYYVYDDLGNLRYVIPPGYTSNTVDTATVSFKDFVYAYNYDGRRRMVEKKIPGKGWEYIVYNKNDQPVLTQDAVQRSKATQEWGYSKYDAFGRVTEIGIYSHSYTDRQAAQIALDTHWDTSSVYWEEKIDSTYTDLTFPTAGIQPLVVNYYDDYVFEGSYRLPDWDIDRSTRTKTLLTGVKVYKDNGTAPLLTVNYYDDRARLIQSAGQNHIGGTDYVTNTYSFIGELLTSKREHRASPSGVATTILTSNTYDHVGRLLTTKHKINDQDEVTLLKNEYNEIGQLKMKSVGSNASQAAFHDSTFYVYNERGWITSASSPNFTYSLKYNSPMQGAAAQYNGNIAEQNWTHQDQTARHFTYGYDKLNRLIDGNSANGSMREQLVYDDMGNIGNLKRDNHPTGTTYSYIGNRLKSLSGAISTVTEYTYDVNGNATKDRTGMNFSYNHLNLPDSAWNATANVGYLYDAMGTKLRKYSNQGGNRDYVGGIEYSSSGIELIHTGVGVAVNNGGTFKYRYNLTDHLGNVRVTVQRNSSSGDVEILQQDDYYPFGMQYQRFASGTENKYLYNGKEKQDELGGGNQYDYGARFYDAEIGRWNVVDPLTEKYISVSPYIYGVNNPVYFMDPDGREIIVGFHKSSTKDANLISAAKKYKDDGAIHIFAHGSPEHIKVWAGEGKKYKDYPIVNAEQLDDFLTEHSRVWKDRKKDEQTTIILHSCNTANDKNGEPSLVEKISKSEQFRDVKIVGGDAFMWANSDGIIGIFPAVEDDSGEPKVDEKGRKIRSNEEGKWRVFENGEETETYKGTWEPKEMPNFWDKLFKVLK